MVKDIFHFGYILRFNPKMLVWVFQALMFNSFYLFHCVFFILSPFKFFLEKIKNDKIQTPKIISSRKIDVVVSIETRKTYCSSEISIFALFNRPSIVV